MAELLANDDSEVAADIEAFAVDGAARPETVEEIARVGEPGADAPGSVVGSLPACGVSLILHLYLCSVVVCKLVYVF